MRNSNIVSLPKMEVIRFRAKKGSGKSDSRECVKIEIKGLDQNGYWPQFRHIDADFKNSKIDFEGLPTYRDRIGL